MAFQNTKSPVKLNDFGIAVQLKDGELCSPGNCFIVIPYLLPNVLESLPKSNF